MTPGGGALLDTSEQALTAEIARLGKVNRALMDRAERSTSVQASDFGLFQAAIMLEDQVRQRTTELEAALRQNETITGALRESEAKFRGLVSQSLAGIAIMEDGKFSYSNGRFDDMFGYSAAEVRSLGPLDLTAEQDRSLVAAHLRQEQSGEVTPVAYVFRGLRKDGTGLDLEIHGSTMAIGSRVARISLVMDVTARIEAAREVQALQEQLREQATHDPLTSLYNRRYLEETLRRELILAARARSPVSLIMADLDHFKAVNDLHGHGGGDEVLRAFGVLLRRHARGSDICCRYGGEEFLLVLPGMTHQLAMTRTETLRSALEVASVPFGAAAIMVTASFGVASFPQHGGTSEEVIAAADGALYAAKAAGRNRVHSAAS